MVLRKLMELLLQARRSNARSIDAIEGAVAEVKRQQDIARRIKRLEIDVKLQTRHK